MELNAKIHSIGETQNVSDTFSKREFIVVTEETYPQYLLLQVVKDKCNVLNHFKVGQQVNVSINLNAIELLRENPDKIEWDILNLNKNAIELLKENPDKIDWDFLSSNPGAIELLKENKDKINWGSLSNNTADHNDVPDNAVHICAAKNFIPKDNHVKLNSGFMVFQYCKNKLDAIITKER